MTLSYLINHVAIQGDIRLSLWSRDGVEIHVVEVHGTETLKGDPTIKFFSRMKMKYMFASSDGMLHIDFEEDDI